MGQMLVGCCGWPEGRAAYYRHFPVVELQTTFYQPPSVELARKWQAEAPPGFRFTLKAWQLITHTPNSPTYRRLKRPIPEAEKQAYGSFRPTPQVRTSWETTLAIARAVQAPVVVFQCPASFRQTADNRKNLQDFFVAIERQGRLIVWEPRGDWEPDVVSEICRRLDLVHCVDPFQGVEPVSTGPVYLRLHGRGGYHYQYKAEELEWLAELCRRQDAAGRDPIYVMFNNPAMREDARRFRALVEGCSGASASWGTGPGGHGGSR
jgi:uncharacterized protein YecE (DUF72 family)